MCTYTQCFISWTTRTIKHKDEGQDVGHYYWPTTATFHLNQMNSFSECITHYLWTAQKTTVKRCPPRGALLTVIAMAVVGLRRDAEIRAAAASPSSRRCAHALISC